MTTVTHVRRLGQPVAATLLGLLTALALGHPSTGAASGVTLRLELQQGHSSVMAVGFSADGGLVATGGERGVVTLWELPSGRQIYQIHGDWELITSVSVTADTLIVAGRQGTTPSQFQLATGQPVPGSERFLDSCAGALVLVERGTNGSILRERRSGRTVASFDFAPHVLEPKTRVMLSCSSDARRALLAVPNQHDAVVAQLWDVAAAKPLQEFSVPDGSVRLAMLSPDGSVVATAAENGPIQFSNADDGRLIRVLSEYEEYAAAVVDKGLRGPQATPGKLWGFDFSADGRLFAAAGGAGVVIWEVATGKPVHIIDGGGSASLVRFSPDGRTVLADVGAPGKFNLFEAEGRVRPELSASLEQTSPFSRRCFVGATVAALPTCYVPVIRSDLSPKLAANTTWTASPDGRYLASVELLEGPRGTWFRETIAARTTVIPYIDLRTGRRARWQFAYPVTGLAFTDDSRRVYFGFANGCVTSWDLEQHRSLVEFCGRGSPVTAMTVSRDETTLLVAHRDGTRRQIDVRSGTAVDLRPLRNEWSDHLQLTSDGRYLIDGLSSTNGVIVDLTHSKTLPFAGEVRVIDRRTEITRATVKVRYRANGMATFNRDGTEFVVSNGDSVTVYETASVRKVRELAVSAFVRRLALSTDGRTLAAATLDGDLSLWDLTDGRRLWSRGRFDDGVVSGLQFISGGRRLLVSLAGGSARLLDASTGSLFLTLAAGLDGDWMTVSPDGRFDANLHQDPPMQWVASTLPLRPLPLSLFMRDYFQPELLVRAMRDEVFPPTRDPTELNLLRPSVRVVGVRTAPTNRNQLTIRVQVTETTNPDTGQRSGATGVRLFRDGRLVAATADGQDLRLVSGSAIVEFPRVRMPDSPSRLDVYAFNVDGIASQTTSYEWFGRLEPADAVRERTEQLSFRLPARDRRAWLLNIGVNATGIPSLDLRYAANDAKVLGDTLARHLKQTSQFERIVRTTLVSSDVARNGASKKGIQSAFAALARRDATGPAIDDLVVISFSGHGFRTADGRFFLVPSSVAMPANAPSSVDPDQLMAQSISSDELSAWLRDVDARVVLIIDACYSGASIASAGFKPGPFGARGLGQIAFDKRMTVLAAAAPDAVAIESDSVRQGLLTYALSQEGLEAGGADWQPRDGRIRLHEWLRYGVVRVPRLANEITARTFDTRNGSRMVDERSLSPVEREGERVPILFAFGDESRDPVVAGTPDPVFEAAQPITMPAGEYPAAALPKRLAGSVRVEVTVAVNGRVTDARIVGSIPVFDRAALSAVRRWTFKPATLGGKPIPMIVQLEIPFAPPRTQRRSPQ